MSNFFNGMAPFTHPVRTATVPNPLSGGAGPRGDCPGHGVPLRPDRARGGRPHVESPHPPAPTGKAAAWLDRRIGRPGGIGQGRARRKTGQAPAVKARRAIGAGAGVGACARDALSQGERNRACRVAPGGTVSGSRCPDAGRGRGSGAARDRARPAA